MAKQTREQLHVEIRRLRAENQQLHATIRTQQQQIQALSERIGKLEQALADARRAGKRQAGPFSRSERNTDLKPPGRRPGQGPFTRRGPPPEDEIDRVVDVPLACCRPGRGSTPAKTPRSM